LIALRFYEKKLVNILKSALKYKIYKLVDAGNEKRRDLFHFLKKKELSDQVKLSINNEYIFLFNIFHLYCEAAKKLKFSTKLQSILD
jgi:hypothetical protein